VTLGEDVAVADVQCEIARSVLGLPGVRAAHRSADNKDHKADQDRKNLLRLVEAQNALTCMKLDSAMQVNESVAN